ncbi:Uncharacterized protein SCF082_LOCUS27954 [Durusdinium trenchii]|uniref:Uncharacterized protein n=1 Tax=Durusdinium trenchii TaxID=1381693 RepID=A0ABP0MJ94_9DINO
MDAETFGAITDKESQSDESDDVKIDAVEILGDWLSQMELTDEKYLRAAPAFRVVECGGRILKQKSRADFAHSTAVKQINKFISHSWQASARSKYMALLVFYNGKAAVVMGFLVAAATMIFFMFDFLPGFMSYAEGGPERKYLGPWCISLGTLMFLLILLFRRPRDLIFLDRLCINQYDEREKSLGVLSLGACLKHSKKIMILWDETFCHRLWCIFELAAFLKTHENTELLAQPLDLTDFLVWKFILNTLVYGGGLVVPYSTNLSDNMFPVLIFIFATCAQCWLVTRIFVCFSQGSEAIQKQLSGFTFAGAQCYCCCANHQTPDGKDIPCDRRVMQQCIQHWFGSVEEFEKVVQTRAKDAFKKHLGGHFCPFWWLAASEIPVLWQQMDVAASRLYERDAHGAIGRIVLGLSVQLLTGPTVFATIILLLRWKPCRGLPLKLLAMALCLCLVFGIHTLFRALFQSLGELSGSLIFAGSFLLPTIILWHVSAYKS